MTTQTNRVSTFSLPPDWMFNAALIRSLRITESGFNQFAGFCVARGLSVADTTEQDFQDFIESLKGSLKATSIEAYRIGIRSALRQLAQNAPDAARTQVSLDFAVRKPRIGHRQRQLESLSQAIQTEIEDLMSSAWKNRTEQTNRAHRNMILRAIALLAAIGRELVSISELTEPEVFNLLTQCNFGGKATSLPDAQQMFLSAAVDIAAVHGPAENLKFLRLKMRSIQTPGGIEQDALAKIIALDQAKLAQLLSFAIDTLMAAAKDGKFSFSQGQAAIAVIAAILSAQSVRALRDTTFAAPFSVESDDVTLSALKIAGREFPMPAELQSPVATFRRRVVKAAGPDSLHVFVRRDGNLKSSTALTVSVNRLSETAGVRTDPETIAGAVVLSLLEGGMPWQKVCLHLGWSQERNFYRRFRPLIDLAGQGKYADQVGGAR